MWFGLCHPDICHGNYDKKFFEKRRKQEDDGDGGVEDFTPPKIDLPPGVQWPTDSPKTRLPEPVEY